MTLLNKILNATLLVTFFSSSTATVHADDTYIPMEGSAYEESYQSSSSVSTLALGAIALTGIIVVLSLDSKGHRHHRMSSHHIHTHN